MSKMSPEQRSEVKKEIALAKAHLSAKDLGAGVAPHTASTATGPGPEQGQARSRQQHSQGQDEDSQGDTDEDHPAPGQAEQAGKVGQADQAGEAGDHQPLPAAGFASTDSYVAPDNLDDDDPWAHPSHPTVNLGPEATASSSADSQEGGESQASADKQAHKLGLPDLSDTDDPWAQADGQEVAAPLEDAPVHAVSSEGAVAPQVQTDSAGIDPSLASTSQIEQAQPGNPAPLEEPAAGIDQEAPRSQPLVAPEDDTYSLDDPVQGQETLLGPEELSKMFEVKHVEDLAADDPKNPLKISRKKREQGFDD